MVQEYQLYINAIAFYTKYIAYGVGTLMVSASQRHLWWVRPEKSSKCIDVADGYIGTIESIGSMGYIGYIVHTGNIPPVK